MITFVLVFLSTIACIIRQYFLPEHHLSEHSKSIIKVSWSVVIGLAALTLGLLIATTKESFDMKGAEPRSSALKLLLLIDYCLNMAKNPMSLIIL